MRMQVRGAMIRGVTVRKIDRITLELEPGEPIQGRLLDASGAAQAFRGWLELCATLDRARQPATAGSEDTLGEGFNVR